MPSDPHPTATATAAPNNHGPARSHANTRSHTHTRSHHLAHTNARIPTFDRALNHTNTRTLDPAPTNIRAFDLAPTSADTRGRTHAHAEGQTATSHGPGDNNAGCSPEEAQHRPSHRAVSG